MASLHRAEPAFESTRDRIRRFVREALGCVCPDAAFERAEVEFAPDGASEALFEIVVGDRLLVRAYRVTPGDGIPTGVVRWLESGRAERDARGLNRFRLVLAGEAPGTIEESAVPAFEQWRGADERIHLHVLRLGQLDALFALPC